MKSDLWDHLTDIIAEEPQQIQKLKGKDKKRAYEIVDIQFAMSDYKYLEEVVAIKKISQEIQRLVAKMEQLNQETDHGKLERYQN